MQLKDIQYSASISVVGSASRIIATDEKISSIVSFDDGLLMEVDLSENEIAVVKKMIFKAAINKLDLFYKHVL